MGLVRDYSLDSKVQLVEGMRKAWRRNFNGVALDPDIWTIVQKGAGQTITVAGGTLTVNQGVGIDEQTIIRSVAKFQIPFRVQFSMWINQRIAQNEVYLELVNAAGDTFTGWMFDGTTATTAKTVHSNGGTSLPASPTAGVTITSTAGSTIREIEARIDSVEFLDRGVDTNASSSSRAVKTRTVLDPYEDYYIQLRFKNVGGIAPASGTITTLETILVQDTNDLLVEINAGRGQNATGKAIPVNIQNASQTQYPSATASSTTSTALNAYRNVALSNASSSIKGSAGKLFGLLVTNPGAAAAYFNVYNSTSPIIGTSTPVIQIWVPAGAVIQFPFDSYGVFFSTGITCAATDTSAALSAVAPGNPLVVTALHI